MTLKLKFQTVGAVVEEERFTMIPQQEITILLNPSSGKSKNPKIDEEIVAAFSKRGFSTKVIQLEKNLSIPNVLKNVQQSGGTLIVAAGGDGTISSVANCLIHSDLSLGLLPVGTLNHFTKDLKIPQDVEKAVDVILSGISAPVDVGEVNSKYFINNSSIGAYPLLVQDREEIQKHGFGKWPAFIQAFAKVFQKFPCTQITISENNTVRKCLTPLVFIGNNRYDLQGFEMGTRSSMNAGVLTVVVTRKTSRLKLIFAVLRRLFGNSHSSVEMETTYPTGISLQPASSSIEVSLDGEVKSMTTPLNYRIIPKALRVIVPTNP